MKNTKPFIIALAIFTCCSIAMLTGCKKAINIEELEKELVGVWWDAFQYSDVT